LPKKLPHTPNSQIRSALRQLWLRSRERAARIKADGYTCQCCGRKQSRAKGREVFVEVHHRHGVDWDGLFDDIRRRLLSGELETLCKECHAKDHEATQEPSGAVIRLR
jgi:predicted HNH restriction endonuclease